MPPEIAEALEEEKARTSGTTDPSQVVRFVHFTTEVLALKHESSILGQWSNTVHCISVIPLSDTAQNRLKGGF